MNSGIGGIIDATVSPSSDATLSRTRVFYYPVQKTDSTGIQVLGVRPADENACTDAFGNKFKSKTDGDYKEFKTTVLDSLQGGNLTDSFVSLSAETDPNDPAKAVFTVTLAGDETFQTKWLDWSKNESAPKVTAVGGGGPGAGGGGEWGRGGLCWCGDFFFFVFFFFWFFDITCTYP